MLLLMKKTIKQFVYILEVETSDREQMSTIMTNNNRKTTFDKLYNLFFLHKPTEPS